MRTGESLTASEGVQRIQTALHANEGMISSESRMREICMSGSTSGDWKRSHGEEGGTGIGESRREQLPPLPTATAPVVDSTRIVSVPLLSESAVRPQ